MTTFQSALDRISKAAQTAGIEVGQAASSPFERISSAVASVEPGAAPGMAASEQDIMGIAARGYEDQLLIPKLPTAAKVATLGLEPREIERGLRTQMTQAAQAVATPGLRAQFIESVLDPLLAVTFPMAYGSLPRPVKTLAAKGLSQALEPSGSGLSVEDLRTEQVAARGAAAGMAAGQEQGFAGEVARGVGQSIPQFLGVAGAVATGQVPAAAAIASQALIPLSAWTGGQLSYMDELDAKRAEEALSGAELSQFDLGEMRKRATASAAIQTGVEVVGAGVGAKAIGAVAGRIAATKPGRAVIARLSEAGQQFVARARASKAGQAGTEAFARATNATGRISSGFLGNAGKIVAISGAEESAEELAGAILESPFTEAPLSDDLKNGVYAAFVGAAAGGVGGVGAVGGAVARKAIVNRREAFRPENDAEIRLRQMHTEAQKARTNWTEDLDESQQAQVSVALNSLNGMAPEERGIFLRDLSDTRSDIESRVEKLLARRQELDAALAGARDAQRTYEAGAPERAAKETLVSEAQAAFDKASEDLRAAQELLTEAESEAQKRPRVARPGRVVVSTEQRQANLEAARSEVAAAQARLESAAQEAGVAEGLEIAPGLRIDPAATVAGIERDIASTDEEMRLLVTDRLVADATYNAVREKISDMPMEYRQQEPSAVLSGIGTSSGVQLGEVKAPKRGGRITREMEALGVRVVWFRGKDKKFGAPAFHSMESRGVVYLNADADMSQVRAKAFHELFHDIQMFRPEIAKAYADRVGLAPIYEAGAKYARGRAESASKQRMDALARIQAAAAGAGLAGFEVAVPAATARAGAARLQQEGEAEAFGATAARVTGRGVLNPFVQFAARRGLMGRDVAAAMAVIDMASRAAAVERVSGVKPVATLSPLARTLLWAEDMAVDIPLEIEQATKPEQEAPAAPAPAAPSPGVSMARASDDEYFAAIERGDMTAVQAMVDAAARAAGYIYSGYHASRVAFERFLSLAEQAEERGEEFEYDGYEGGNLGRGFYFTPDQSYAKRFGTPRKFYLKIDNIVDARKPEVLDRLRVIYKDLVEEQGGADQGEAYDALVEEMGANGVIAADAGGFAYGAEEILIKQSNQAKLADPIVRDADGNIIPLSRRFDVSRPEISFARSDEDSEVDSLRKQIADLQRQVRDVQNVTAAQRANALREVRVLERRLVTAERIAEQKTLQATRAKMRLELERQAAQEDVAAVERDMAKVTSKLDASQAAVKQMRTELSALRRGERLEERLADAERTAQRAIDWAYAIGRNEGLLAGEVRGQQVERRQVRKLSQRLDEVQARLDKAIPALREARAQIKSDSAAAQRAIDFAYGMGLAKGRIQGVMEGRRQVLKRMARREDVLQNQLFNLRKVMQERAERAEDVRDAAQAIARDAARMLPEKLRGPLAVRIANVKTPEQANRIAIVAVKLAVDAEVNESIAAIARLRKQLKKRGMRYATRQRVEALLDSAEAGLRTASGRRIRAVVTPGKGPKAGPIGPAIENAVDIYAAVVDAASKVEQATLLYQLDRTGWLMERAQRLSRYNTLRDDLVNAMSGRPTLEERERSDLPPRLPIAKRIARANSDIYTLMLELEGTSTGVINELLSKAQAGKGEASLEHASILRQIVPALQAAGYSGISDYALKNGLLGQASANVRTVQIGGEDVTVPVGTLIDIAAMDDKTFETFPSKAGERGQSIKFPDSASTREFYPTQQDIIAIRNGLTAGERGLIDAMKNTLENQIRDRVFEAVYSVDGDMPPVEKNYWMVVREVEQKADANLMETPAGTLVRNALTNVGFVQARVGGSNPILYSDAFQKWERHVQVSLDMIHMAQPYRDAATVLTAKSVIRGLDMQMGKGTAAGLLAIFSNGVGATARSNPTLIDKLTNNITGAILAMRPRTLGKVVVGGQIRLMSEIPVEYMARGVARSTKPRTPQSWNARIDEIHAVNGYFNRRHQLHMRSIISGSLSDADRVKVSTAWQASIDSLRATGNNLAAAQLTDAFENFKDAGNGANLMIAAAVDALRYMDEQIMLTAVEARLAEVEDEGVLAGQDALREAALRAERDFRRTQNASDEFDDTFFFANARVKGQQGIRLLFPFTSDPLKARNQIRRAYLSGDRRLETAAAIGGNAAASTIIGSASLVTVGYMVSLIAGLLGGDDPTDEEEKKFKEEAKKIPARLAAEILSSTAGIPGVVMGQVVQGMQYRKPLFAPLLGRPIEQAGREMTADDLPVLVRIIPATLALTQYLGFPMYGLYEFVKDFIPEGEKTTQEKMRERIERRRESMTPEKIRERIQRRISQ